MMSEFAILSLKTIDILSFYFSLINTSTSLPRLRTRNDKYTKCILKYGQRKLLSRKCTRHYRAGCFPRLSSISRNVVSSSSSPSPALASSGFLLITFSNCDQRASTDSNSLPTCRPVNCCSSICEKKEAEGHIQQRRPRGIYSRGSCS